MGGVFLSGAGPRPRDGAEAAELDEHPLCLLGRTGLLHPALLVGDWDDDVLVQARRLCRADALYGVSHPPKWDVHRGSGKRRVDDHERIEPDTGRLNGFDSADATGPAQVSD